MCKKLGLVALCLGVWFVLDHSVALAVSTGDPMPWDGPLKRIFSNFQGVVGPLLLGLSIFGFTFTALNSEHHLGSGLVRIILVGSVILFVTGFMTSLWGWAGATF